MFIIGRLSNILYNQLVFYISWRLTITFHALKAPKAMRKIILVLTCILTLPALISCSSDDVNEDLDVLGVWENVIINAESTNTLTLVFGKNSTGLKISSETFSTDEIISSSVAFNWEKNNEEVIIVLEGETTQSAYLLNSEGQLVLSSSGDMLLDKVSDDYSKYY